MPIKPDVLMAKFDAILNIGIDCGEGEYRKKNRTISSSNCQDIVPIIFSAHTYI